MQFSSMSSISPSFTVNSSNNLADIAARVVQEFRNENRLLDDDIDIYAYTNELEPEPDDEAEEAEFEFAVASANPNLSHVSADEIFSNGEIMPRYPLFDQSLLLDNNSDNNSNCSNNNNSNSLNNSSKSKHETKSQVVRHPLGELFKEERETTSYSDANLAGVAPETYCIWKPKVESPERCKKSNSTGNSSKRWRFGSFLHRSNSDSRMATAVGKDAPVAGFIKRRGEKVKKVDGTAKVAGADDDGGLIRVADDVKSGNKIFTGGSRIRSYLRYKKEQVLPH